VSLKDIKVSEGEIEEAGRIAAGRYPQLIEAIKTAFNNLEEYHIAQSKKEPESWFINPHTGKRLGQILTSLNRVGLYIPGGRYLYPSSVLMSAVPAKIAGVKEIAVCTPPQKDGSINEILLYLFSFLGINEIYKIGGAQAIAAFAFGTENIKKVDKIAGPGNIYVTAAKKLVYGAVGIDSLAGPSEVLIIADKSADPSHIAADLLSQAEHDPDATCILLSTEVPTVSFTT
ncbi:MAG: histidinol dehydrogenase, partial [Actinobacteria bacterium]|nr:histidinol dehydrogenase [Actinomycetota bacterium]